MDSRPLSAPSLSSKILSYGIYTQNRERGDRGSRGSPVRPTVSRNRVVIIMITNVRHVYPPHTISKLRSTDEKKDFAKGARVTLPSTPHHTTPRQHLFALNPFLVRLSVTIGFYNECDRKLVLFNTSVTSLALNKIIV